MNKNRKILLAAVAAVSMTAAVPALAQQNQSNAPQSQNQGQSQAQPANQSISASNRQIRQAQQALNNKGFKAGRADGKMGPETRQALKDFQNQQKLQATGQLDNQTMAALGMKESSSQRGTIGQGRNGGPSSQQGTVGQGRNTAPQNVPSNNNPPANTQNPNQSH
jgi:peptidoglycan hydrolase-like protein with peptidoglycan-binding domain